MTKTVERLLARKGTWEMTAEELARVWADHYGYEGRKGGWIYGPTDKPVCQGWGALARRMNPPLFSRPKP